MIADDLLVASRGKPEEREADEVLRDATTDE